METFIVYNLDTRLPVSVGESIKAELARFETAEKTKIRAENLIAEEISLPKMWERSETYSKKPWGPPPQCTVGSNVFAYNVSLSVVHEVEVVVAKERVFHKQSEAASTAPVSGWDFSNCKGRRTPPKSG
jgi:hypothetical protein